MVRKMEMARERKIWRQIEWELRQRNVQKN
jgi:hypothetical protein